MFNPYHACIAGLFTCLLILSGCGQGGNGLSANATITQGDRDAVNQQPDHAELFIHSHPQSLTVTETESFSLSVQATSEAPLHYQWYQNDQAISGAIYPSYSKATSSVNDQGLYHVEVSTYHVKQKSLSANINISLQSSQLKIVQAPQGQSISEGDSLFLSVEAEGEGALSYRWQKNGSVIPNATSSHYLVSRSQKSDQGSYRAIVSNNLSTVYSNFVNVWINDAIEPLSISVQPISQLIPENNSAVLSVLVNGGGFISYQWRKNGLPIANAYSSTFALPNVSTEDEGAYDVVIANSQGSLVSNTAYLDVLPVEPPLMISQQPLSQSIQLGQSFTLNVGTSVTATPLNFQWFLNDIPLPGANSAIYRVEQAGQVNLGIYSVLISNADTELRSAPTHITLHQAENRAIELSWETPQSREDGSRLEASEILGYIIEYGYEAESLNQRVEVSQQVSNNYILEVIQPGRLFLRIATMDIDGFQGSFSDTISLTID